MGGSTLSAEWTVREVLNWTRGYFEDAGIVQPRLEAEILLAHALEVERLHLYLSPDKPLTVDERAKFKTFIQQRRAGTPLQHLIGEVTFFGLRFKVRRDALIPRAETEQLLDRTLRLVARDQSARCLDLGTGSGVIAVCLARYLPRASVTAVDISAGALELARENATLNGVVDRVAFLESDWFANVSGSFDLIVSNPPYVETSAIEGLAVEVRDHEPRVALDGGTDGIEQIRELVAGAGAHLERGGRLLLEIGHGQGERVQRLLIEAGLDDVLIERDLSGLERFAVGRRPA
ncbi:MAG: peptide chain release factor N(5)-glutamine methyltransferase [Candidatus Bipolaricaulota bacterium]|nr:peptide chain release factor N(5)-glutamine methyltransferase [Candidatus Bipolaricaulota bacterium]